MAEMPGLTEELRAHIYQAHADGPRRASRWVMNQEWFSEVRRLETGGSPLWHPSLNVGRPELLLGIPVEVREDGGVPHLEAMLCR